MQVIEMKTIKRAVIVERNGQRFVVPVTIAMPENMISDAYVDEHMILDALASGQRRTYFSRHGEESTTVTPESVAEHYAACDGQLRQPHLSLVAA